MIKFLQSMYNKVEAIIQFEIPWYVTENGKMYIDVDKFVKRDCWKQVLEDFESTEGDWNEEIKYFGTTNNQSSESYGRLARVLTLGINPHKTRGS